MTCSREYRRVGTWGHSRRVDIPSSEFRHGILAKCHIVTRSAGANKSANGGPEFFRRPPCAEGGARAWRCRNEQEVARLLGAALLAAATWRDEGSPWGPWMAFLLGWNRCNHVGHFALGGLEGRLGGARRTLAVSVSRRVRARLVGQGIVAHFAELAARTFRAGFHAGVVGEVFDQVEELDAAVLGDGTLEDTPAGREFRTRIRRLAPRTRCADLSIGIACPPRACWITVAVT